MNDLRFILLLIGVAIIASIYIWGTIAQRRQDLQQQRKQTIDQDQAKSEPAELRITPRLDADDNYSHVISDLSEFLTNSKLEGDDLVDEPISPAIALQGKPEPEIKSEVVTETESDLFSTSAVQEEDVTDTELLPKNKQFSSPEKIITLNITAPSIKSFNGPDIVRAMKIVELKYGDMNIFHHYGIGQMKTDCPLFSLANMFDPGSFDLDDINSLSTRGLTLFLCLPAPLDAEVVFELMLNTAQRLVEILGGELRGADHSLIDESHIAAMRSDLLYHPG